MYCKDTCLSNDCLILFSLSIKLDYHSCTKYIHTLKKNYSVSCDGKFFVHSKTILQVYENVWLYSLGRVVSLWC